MIFDVTTPIHHFEGDTVKPGGYSYPFKIQLPNWIPSSFVYCGEEASKIRIFYTLKAKIEDCRTYSGKDKPLPSLKFKRRLNVANNAMSLLKDIKVLSSDKAGKASA